MTQVALILPQSISAIGTFTKLDNSYLNAAHSDYLAIDPGACTGFGDAPLRTTVDDAPGLDGVLIEPPRDGGLVLTLAGDIVVTSTGSSNDTGYIAAVVALYQELKASLDLLKASPGTLTHSAGSMKVWKQSELDPTWTSFWTLRVTFSLIQDVFA